MNRYLAALDDVVNVFSAAIDVLLTAASIRTCGRGQRLPSAVLVLPSVRSAPAAAHVRAVADHYAAVVCRYGRRYRFHLGSGTLSSASWKRSDRWSPDVSLPVHLNRLASGIVAGRSSALYGMVLNEVMERALAAAAASIPLGLRASGAA